MIKQHIYCDESSLTTTQHKQITNIQMKETDNVSLLSAKVPKRNCPFNKSKE
jgi:hypothetical protein